MMKRLWLLMLVVSSLFLGASPVAAAPREQGSEGVHFGSYTLSEGDTFSGDLVVIGGPVLLESGAVFKGDLTVFGSTEIEEGALVDGSLVVTGSADIDGDVDGDVVVVGDVSLGESAHIYGDFNSFVEADVDDEATIDGVYLPPEDTGAMPEFPLDINILPKSSVREPRSSASFIVRLVLDVGRAILNICVFGLLALVITSVWPQQTECVGRVVEESPLLSFGVGLMSILISLVVVVLLVLSFCLVPIAIFLCIILGVGLLLGLVAVGLILGQRVMSSIFGQNQPNLVIAALVGTALIILVLALTRISGPLHLFLLFILLPLAAGSVVLTRFGVYPYSTQGKSRVPSSPPPAPANPAVRIVPAPLPPAPVAYPPVAPPVAEISETPSQGIALIEDLVSDKDVEAEVETLDEDISAE